MLHLELVASDTLFSWAALKVSQVPCPNLRIIKNCKRRDREFYPAVNVPLNCLTSAYAGHFLLHLPDRLRKMLINALTLFYKRRRRWRNYPCFIHVSYVTYDFSHSLWLPFQTSGAIVYLKTIWWEKKANPKWIINWSGKTDSTFPPLLSVQTGTTQMAVLNGLLLESEVSFKPRYSNQL